MSGAAAGDRYVVISSDCHGGASLEIYREYLDPEFREEFDAWAADFEVPWDDLVTIFSDDYKRNFDSSVRQPQVEGEGVVGEVLFPNTIPPFFSTLAFLQGSPKDAESLRRSWAGFRAHNRWLADFCNELPGRRAGIAQVWLNDVDLAIEELHRIKDGGIFGGVILPVPAPGSGAPPLFSPEYEPFWSACEELGLPINSHGGGGIPEGDGFYDGDAYPASGAVKFTENGWYSTRVLSQLLISGVFERHPGLHFAITETGTNTWIPQTLRNLDWLVQRVRNEPNSRQALTAGETVKSLSLLPSEYFARNCWLGASFMNKRDAEVRDETGVDKVMWGNDFPHYEGTYPFTREAMRWTFQGIDPTEVQMMLGANAADMYGFDLEALAPVAAKVGPTVDELAGPMDPSEIPVEATSEALATHFRPVGRFY